MAIDGFYRFVYSGRAGSGLGLIALHGGKITGVDAGGGEYEGQYSQDALTGGLTIRVALLVPPNVPLVIGVEPRDEAWTLPIDAKLPANFAGAVPVSVPTPFGPISVSFKLLRAFEP
jgi:hypothetical protein